MGWPKNFVVASLGALVGVAGCTSLNANFDPAVDASGASAGLDGGQPASATADTASASGGGNTAGPNAEGSTGQGSHDVDGGGEDGDSTTRSESSSSGSGSAETGEFDAPPRSVVVFAVPVLDGAFGLDTDPFEEMTEQCAVTAWEAGLPCDTGVPLLSTQDITLQDVLFALYANTDLDDDSVLDLAAQLLFFHPEGDEIAFSWQQFLYGPHQFPGPFEPYLDGLGFEPESDGVVWTGAWSPEQPADDSCDNWSNWMDLATGGVGNLVDAASMPAQSDWAWNSVQTCNEPAHVLCLCPS